MSYFYPLSIRRTKGDGNHGLEVLLYQNRFQLTTSDALYSDGRRYIPAVMAVRKLRRYLPSIHMVLVLGAGLCSMVGVLRRRGCDAAITIVDNDRVVLDLAMEFAEDAGSITPLCQDAMLFMEHNTARYDFIFIDVFIGRVVPRFVVSPRFLGMCRDSLTDGGHVAFNYIVNDKQQWEEVQSVFTGVFPDNEIVSAGVNRILVGHV